MRILVVVAMVMAVTMGVAAVMDWVFLFRRRDIHKEREKKR